MTPKPSVLISCDHLIRNIEEFRSSFEKVGVQITLPQLNGQQFDAAEMLKLLPGHSAAIVGDDHVTAEVLQASQPSLRALIKWGIGTDNIDLESAKQLNVPVYNTPGQFSSEVADLAIGMMLSLARQINFIDHNVRNGNWIRIEGESIAGSKAHIIGMGNIGQSIAKRLLAFDVSVSGSDPCHTESSEDFQRVDLKMGITDADWVFVACALTSDNLHLINDELMSAMKVGARIINIARGPLVEEKSLFRHLSTGHLHGAGLDVFETEPFSSQNPIAQLPNVILGSHGGSSTKQAIHRVNSLTVKMALELISTGSLDTSHKRANA